MQENYVQTKKLNENIEGLATFYGTIYKSIERFVMPGSWKLKDRIYNWVFSKQFVHEREPLESLMIHHNIFVELNWLTITKQTEF